MRSVWEGLSNELKPVEKKQALTKSVAFVILPSADPRMNT